MKKQITDKAYAEALATSLRTQYRLTPKERRVNGRAEATITIYRRQHGLPPYERRHAWQAARSNMYCCYLCESVPVVKVAYYGGSGGSREECERTCVDRHYYCANCTSLLNSAADPHAGWVAEFPIAQAEEML